MSTPGTARTNTREGEALRDAAHSLPEAHREFWIRRARRALLARLIECGTATADDVFDDLGTIPGGLDPRWLGAVPGALAKRNIIEISLHNKSFIIIINASVITVWTLSDHAAALAWLAAHPDPDDDAAAGDSSLRPGDAPTPKPLQSRLTLV